MSELASVLVSLLGVVALSVLGQIGLMFPDALAQRRERRRLGKDREQTPPHRADSYQRQVTVAHRGTHPGRRGADTQVWRS